MTYLSGKSRKSKEKYGYAVYAGIVLLVAFFWVGVKASAYPVFEPVVKYYANIKYSVKSIPEFFSTYTTSRSTLVAKTKTLEVTIENLENQIAEKDAKLEELGMSKSELGDISGSVLTMYPLMEDVTRIYSTILLSKGFKDGVEKGEYVYVRGLQPVCMIKEVYTSTSLCGLLSSSGTITEAVIIGDASTTPISIALLGRGGGAFLGDVARDASVAIGDKVVLKSDHSMTLGNVVDILHNNQDTSWHVFVRGAYNPVTSSIFYLRKNK